MDDFPAKTERYGTTIRIRAGGSLPEVAGSLSEEGNQGELFGILPSYGYGTYRSPEYYCLYAHLAVIFNRLRTQ